VLGATHTHNTHPNCSQHTPAGGGGMGCGNNRSDDASTGEVEMEAVPKFSDCGLSRIMREGATHHSTHTMGTITRQAPGVRVGIYRVFGEGGCCWVVGMGVASM
jgi:hypothetical protein